MSEPLPQRERFDRLEAVEGPAAIFQEAMTGGRLHHAWLLAGPKGLGKAAVAFQAARRLLGAAPDPAFGLLGSSPGDPVNRLIAARSHPDLTVLDRDETGENRRTISVDEARRLPEVFTKAPGLAKRRVAIIDAADDLNANAANAVLKTLEEPPTGSVIFLVCHAPGRLLPTIRSRCRRLTFRSWTEAELQAFATRNGVAHQPGAASPGELLLRSAGDAFDGRAMLDHLPQIDLPALQKLTDRFRGAEGATAFAGVVRALSQAARERAVSDPARGAEWAGLWRRLDALPGEVEAVNLDRADALWSVMGELRTAGRVS